MITEATKSSIAAAAEALRAGALVAFPTETVYGLGADATNGRAVAAVFAAKGRPRFNPLIVHVPDVAAARALAVFDPLAERLAAAFWPGPLTLVLPKRVPSPIAELATADLESIALRVPAQAIAQGLLRAVGRPLAAPSANRSGHVSPTTAAHVEADLGDRVAMILDGGPATVGLESTVIAVMRDRIELLRTGAVTREALASVADMPIGDAPSGGADRPTSPGRLAVHYAPRARLRLEAIDVRPGEALLAFGPRSPQTSGPTINLSPTGDLVEAAATLFAALRALDATDAETIAVMPVPDHGLGEAINDRLRRAAAPR